MLIFRSTNVVYGLTGWTKKYGRRRLRKFFRSKLIRRRSVGFSVRSTPDQHFHRYSKRNRFLMIWRSRYLTFFFFQPRCLGLELKYPLIIIPLLLPFEGPLT